MRKRIDNLPPHCYLQRPTGPTEPMGLIGPTGSMGPQGEKREQRPQEPRGEEDPQGPPGIQGDQGFQGPKGDKGEPGKRGEPGSEGPPGPLESPAAIFITFDVETPVTGIRVNASNRLPIELKISDEENNFTLDTDQNLITIKNPGIYRVDFTVYATAISDTVFVKNDDIIAVG